MLLHRDWDPIGTSGAPETTGEYDSYVGQVYQLVTDGADVCTLAAHLARIADKDIGFSNSDVRDRCQCVAERLRCLLDDS